MGLENLAVSKIIVFAICFALLLSFGIHEFVPHNHLHMNMTQIFLGIQLDTMFHGENKVWLLIALLATCLLLSFNLFQRVLSTYALWITRNIAAHNIKTISNAYDPFREMLRTGIMHPKIYR